MTSTKSENVSMTERVVEVIAVLICLLWVADVLTAAVCFVEWGLGGFVWPQHPGLLATSAWGIIIIPMFAVLIGYVGMDLEKRKG